MKRIIACFVIVLFGTVDSFAHLGHHKTNSNRSSPIISTDSQKTNSKIQTAHQNGRENMIGNVSKSLLNNMGCGCYFRFPGTRRESEQYIFLSPIEDSSREQEAWMNIDGRDVKLRLVSSTQPRGQIRLGSRLTRTYAAGNLTVQAIYVATRVCKPNERGCEATEFAATFTVKKAGRTQVVKAIGGCGC